MAIDRRMTIIGSSQQDNVLCLRVQGVIQRDFDNNQPDPLPDALGTTGFGGKVLLDLSAVEYINTGGYSWLLHQNRAFQKAGGTMVLHSIPSLLMPFFGTARADLVFRIAADEASALQVVREAA